VQTTDGRTFFIRQFGAKSPPDPTREGMNNTKLSMIHLSRKKGTGLLSLINDKKAARTLTFWLNPAEMR
jgi:hypothetical protein